MPPFPCFAKWGLHTEGHSKNLKERTGVPSQLSDESNLATIKWSPCFVQLLIFFPLLKRGALSVGETTTNVPNIKIRQGIPGH